MKPEFKRKNVGAGEKKFIAKNKKAYFDYEVLETFEAGIILIGAEVKSVRLGRVQLKGSFVTVRGGHAFTENMHISPYAFAPVTAYNPLRRRELLLNRKELDYLEGQTSQKGFTIVPLEMYLKNNHVKTLLGICRGKKFHDKRSVLKKRAVGREIDQGLKRFSR